MPSARNVIGTPKHTCLPADLHVAQLTSHAGLRSGINMSVFRPQANCNLADHSTGASTDIAIPILSRASNVVRRSSQAQLVSLFVESERRIDPNSDVVSNRGSPSSEHILHYACPPGSSARGDESALASDDGRNTPTIK